MDVVILGQPNSLAKREARRSDIATLLPKGCTFSLRRIGFQDLARDHGYALTVTHRGERISAGSSVIPAAFHRKHRAVFDAIKQIKADFTWKGSRIL